MAHIKSAVLFFLLVGIAVPTLSFASDDDALLMEYRKNLSENMTGEIADQLRSEFKDSGLPPSDVEAVVANLAEAISTCFIESLVEFTRQRDIPLSDLIGDGDGGIEFKGDTLVLADEFQALVGPCIYSARAEAGL